MKTKPKKYFAGKRARRRMNYESGTSYTKEWRIDFYHWQTDMSMDRKVWDLTQVDMDGYQYNNHVVFSVVQKAYVIPQTYKHLKPQILKHIQRLSTKLEEGKSERVLIEEQRINK